MSILMVPDYESTWPSLGGQVCDFIEENLVFGPGDLRGEPARLDQEKRGLIWRMYEVFPQGHAQAGRRRFKRACLSLAKGLAKTELAAWIAACELHPEAPVRTVSWDREGNPIGGPVRDPYIPLVAYTEEQSDELAYGTLRVILEEGPLAADFDIGLERITRRRGDGKAVSLASSPQGRDGARTTFQVADETHWWTSDRLRQAHSTMMQNIPKRRLADAWALEVTTAPEPGGGSVAESALEYARAVEEGRAKDARYFCFYRWASDDHDLDTEEGAREAVREASGLANWRDEESVIELWRDPTTDRAYWQRVWCNQMVRSSAKAFDVPMWDGLKRDDHPVQDGDLITLGFDGAMFHDATGLVATHVETGYQWVLGVWECPYGAREWQVPEEEVEDAIAAAFDRWTVWRLYADPPYWQAWIAKWAGQFGSERIVEWWTNRRTAMTNALEAYATAMQTGALSHDGNVDMRRHIGNAHRHELPQLDEQGQHLWLIRKERSDSPHKIDLAMAGCLSWEAYMDCVAAGPQSPQSHYQTHDLRIL